MGGDDGGCNFHPKYVDIPRWALTGRNNSYSLVLDIHFAVAIRFDSLFLLAKKTQQIVGRKLGNYFHLSAVLSVFFRPCWTLFDDLDHVS